MHTCMHWTVDCGGINAHQSALASACNAPRMARHSMARHSAVHCIAPLHYHHYHIMLLQHTCCTLHMGRHCQGLGCIMRCIGRLFRSRLLIGYY